VIQCPTCLREMVSVNEGKNPAAWWCPCCGTIRTNVPQPHYPVWNRAPSLVETARKLADATLDLDDFATLREDVLDCCRTVVGAKP
jgi:hypothetical protein